MDFFVLSLPEAVFLYMGLGIQALMRQSSLRHIPGTLVLLWSLVLFWRVRQHRGSSLGVVGYLSACLMIVILFWPEAVTFGRLGPSRGPEQVASYAAHQDPEATVVTAADTGQVPDTLAGPTLMAPGFHLLLRAITQTPLALARAINNRTHRTFASLMPLQWLFGVELTTEVTHAVGDWVHNCYLPAQTVLMQEGQGRTVEELLPWDNSPLRQGLARREVVPGAQTGIHWLRAPGTVNTVRCDVYLDAVELRVQRWLFDLKSPAGRPLLDVFAEELALDPLHQGRFLVYREMLRAAGPAVPAPSLTSQYALLRGLGVAASVLGSGLDSRTTAGALMARGLPTGLFGFGTGAASAAITGGAHEIQRAVEGLSWLLGLAVFLTWWGPYIIGMVLLVLVGLFPFVVLWALIPQSQFQPLAHYFVALLFVSSTPLWWALVDVAARLAQSLAPRAETSGLQAITAVFSGAAWHAMVTALGILLIPVVLGSLLFVSFRGLNSAWRGGV